jgi:hypothetical protein
VRFLPVRELPDVVPVQRPHDADPGKHRRAATRYDHQGLHRRLSLGCHVFGFWQLGDVVAGDLEGDDLAAAGRSIGPSKGRFQPVGVLRIRPGLRSAPAALAQATATCKAQVKEQAQFHETSLYERHKMVKKCVQDALAHH